MHHDDPWIFEMLWTSEHREELRYLAGSRLAGLAIDGHGGSSSARRGRLTMQGCLQQVTHGLRNGIRPWLRRPSRISEGGT